MRRVLLRKHRYRLPYCFAYIYFGTQRNNDQIIDFSFHGYLETSIIFLAFLTI